jgi:hypothetical protein
MLYLVNMPLPRELSVIHHGVQSQPSRVSWTGHVMSPFGFGVMTYGILTATDRLIVKAVYGIEGK